MFVIFNGIYQKQVFVNLDHVIQVRPSDHGGCVLTTLSNSIDLADSFETVVETIQSIQKRR